MSTRDTHLTDLEIIDSRVVGHRRDGLVVEYRPGARPPVGTTLADAKSLLEIVRPLGASETLAVVRRGPSPPLGTRLSPAEPLVVPSFAEAAGSALVLDATSVCGGISLAPSHGATAEVSEPSDVLTTGATALDILAPLPVGAGLALVADDLEACRALGVATAGRLQQRGVKVLWVGGPPVELAAEGWVQLVADTRGDGAWPLAGRAALTLASTVRGPLLVVFDQPETWLSRWAAEISEHALPSLETFTVFRQLLGRLYARPLTSVCALLDPDFLALGLDDARLAELFESQARVAAGGIIEPRHATTRLAHADRDLADRVRQSLAEASKLRDHIAIFGEEDLEPEQWELLEATATLTRSLAGVDGRDEVERLVHLSGLGGARRP